MDAIVEQIDLPNDRFGEAWNTIKLPQYVRDRLEAQALRPCPCAKSSLSNSCRFMA
jgi:hypothetical protein